MVPPPTPRAVHSLSPFPQISSANSSLFQHRLISVGQSKLISFSDASINSSLGGLGTTSHEEEEESNEKRKNIGDEESVGVGGENVAGGVMV